METEKKAEDIAAARIEATTSGSGYDHASHKNFYDYYAKESQTAEAYGRFSRVRDTVLRIYGQGRPVTEQLQMADVGCGAGTQSLVWAEVGHAVHALDVNEPLLQLGRERAAERGFKIDFQVGTATKLPWTDESMDVCIALELIEHVAEWKACVNEFARVVKPGGILYMTTSNWLCPKQQEFTLPLYSWYPGKLKRHYEKAAVTTRPDLANYALYPAVNWFSFYELRSYLRARGFRSLDRFDMMDTANKGTLARVVAGAIRSNPLLRFLGQVCTEGTMILAIKDRR